MSVLIKTAGKTIDLFSQMLPGRILDVPAGGGEECAQAHQRGWQPVAADICANGRYHSMFPWVVADANEGFPFKQDCFDYVLCREGIEHFETQAGFLRECARVLKPGGKLVVTTPNIMHLSARLSSFLTCQRSLRRGLANEVQTFRGMYGRRVYHGHIFLIDYFRLRYLLRIVGFDRIHVYTDCYSATSLALGWITPLLFLASRLSVSMSKRLGRRKAIKLASGPLLEEIFSHVFSPALLFGKRMIVVAEKIDS